MDTARSTLAPAWPARLGVALRSLRLADWLAIAVSVLGLILRVEHALTFDGPTRGSDYGVYVQGVHWMAEHRRPFNFDLGVKYQIRYQPPLWYALGAVIFAATDSDRAISALAVGGWVVRQILLAKILQEAAPGARWSRFAALALNALLPLSVLIDGKVNPEGFHATVFMIAVYVLWRMERQVGTVRGIRTWTALAFGVVAGLAILTKATSSMLLIAAALVLLWRAGSLIRRAGWWSASRRLLAPAFVAALTCGVVIGWWCVPNIREYGHPFPHDWDLERTGQGRVALMMEVPIWKRRPLEWFLPFEWSYLSFPIITTPTEPPPNFWAAAVAGTWSDWYNRGFCRLKGKRSTDRVWGGENGFMTQHGVGNLWSVSLRCVHLLTSMVRIGAGLSLAAIAAVAHTAFTHVLSGGRRGSLVLPMVAAMTVFFIMLFAVTYPFDSSSVLNPRYLLPAATPIAACFGMTLAAGEKVHRRPTLGHLLALLAIGAIGFFLLRERLGR